MSQPETAAISEPMKTLLGLFESEFADVKFPNLDARVLADAARSVLASAERVAQARAALEAAEAELQEQQEALLNKGHRAMAYARVFAEDSPELQQKLDLITLPRSSRRPRSDASVPSVGPEIAPRRRGRPPKQRADAPNLFTDDAHVDLEAVESAAAAN